jgi:hypothetical protein
MKARSSGKVRPIWSDPLDQVTRTVHQTGIGGAQGAYFAAARSSASCFS